MRRDIPIACSLSAAEAEDRAAEFAGIFAHTVATVERDPLTLSVTLRAGVDPSKVAALLAREQECCPFYNVEITAAAGGLRVAVRVPRGAGLTLDWLQSLAEDSLAAQAAG
jgi:hypothetical protein